MASVQRTGAAALLVFLLARYLVAVNASRSLGEASPSYATLRLGKTALRLQLQAIDHPGLNGTKKEG